MNGTEPMKDIHTMPIIGEIRAFAFGPDGAMFNELEKRGWLPCDGRSLPKGGDYGKLEKALGETWGSDDRDNSFCIPELSGRFIRGVGLSPRTADPDAHSRAANRPDLSQDTEYGGATGNAVGSYQADENKQHNHRHGSSWWPNGGMYNNTRGYLAGGDQGHETGYYAVKESGGSESRGRNVYVLWCIFTGHTP